MSAQSYIKGKQKMVLLVTTEVLRPYKANEIIGVPEDIARKLLNVNMQDEFGQVYRPKVRLYNPAIDEQLQLQNGTLNQKEAEKLLKRLHPELVDNDEDEDDDEGTEFPDTDEAPTEFEKIIHAQTATGKRGRPKGSTNKQ